MNRIKSKRQKQAKPCNFVQSCDKVKTNADFQNELLEPNTLET